MRLKNKVAVVTASTRGIGRAIVTKFAEEGAIVYMAARNKERAQVAIDEYKKLGQTVKFVYNDATKIDTFKSMIDEVVEAEGRIDILVNNFGTSDPSLDKNIETTSPEDFSRFIDINLKSVFISSQAAISYMKKQQSGSIINISSVGGTVPDISQIAYGTSKAAINHMTRMIAIQEGRNNIRCNAVCPGITATDAVKNNLSDDFQNLFMKHIPIKRMGTPEEIASAVCYFASDEAAYTTGQILEVSGGFGIATPVFGDLADFMTSR